jgi:hypothetical protein
MKKVVILCVVIFSLFVIASCSTCSSSNSKRNQYIADKMVTYRIIYFKDPRTNLCFAYDLDKGSIAAVSCDSIPSKLLIVAKVKK